MINRSKIKKKICKLLKERANIVDEDDLHDGIIAIDEQIKGYLDILETNPEESKPNCYWSTIHIPHENIYPGDLLKIVDKITICNILFSNRYGWLMKNKRKLIVFMPNRNYFNIPINTVPTSKIIKDLLI